MQVFKDHTEIIQLAVILKENIYVNSPLAFTTHRSLWKLRS
jgi:hypothetical protein